jgi:hypothetical protein
MPEDAIIRIDSEAAAKRVEDAERVPVFEVDGTVYTVAKVTRADIAWSTSAGSRRTARTRLRRG